MAVRVRIIASAMVVMHNEDPQVGPESEHT